MSTLVEIEYRSPAAILILNRPDKRNALNRELITALRLALVQQRDISTVRCIILTGAGKAFCAGMDLDELQASQNAKQEQLHEDAQNLGRLFDELTNYPKPTIAAVNGPAFAGGAGLVSMCDLAIAVPQAKIGYPEVRRGLVAAMVMPHLLRLVGERMARYLLLTGEPIEADQAVRSGLINQIADNDYLMPSALAMASLLSEGGPEAIQQTKELLFKLRHSPLTFDQLVEQSVLPRFREESREGLAAFFSQIPTPWSHRS